jgi:hypothetical protein
MPANSSGITSFTLRLGVDEFLYSNISASGAQAEFGIPPQDANYRGILIVQAVPIPAGGTITTLTAQLEMSLEPDGQDPTAIFGIFQKVVPVSAGPATLSPYSGWALASGIPVAIDISGAGGTGSLRFNFTTLTLGTATGINIFARIG